MTRDPRLCRLGVSIYKEQVTLTFDCCDAYAAIALHDAIITNADDGFVRLELIVSRRHEEPA